jgi:hypothetical protein
MEIIGKAMGLEMQALTVEVTILTEESYYNFSKRRAFGERA